MTSASEQKSAKTDQTSSVQKETGKVEGYYVKKRNGRLEPLMIDKINRCAARACEGLEDVSASEIVLDAHMQLYNKVPTAEIDRALIMSARSKIEKEPNYAYAAARMLANSIYKEVFGEGVDHDSFALQYKKAFIVNLKKLVKADRIDKRLLDFDLKRLAEVLDISRDNKFKYLGLQTLYDRYFVHIDGRRMETPQAFWMRVAMGLSLNEADKDAAAIEFYNVFSQFLYCPSTPTLFNAGTLHSQLSSCYLSTVDDSIDGIFGLIHGQARLSKYAGGLGIDVTPLRSTNSYIKGTNGKSNGLVPWAKIINDMLVAVNQCFAPDTRVFTADGPKRIAEVREGDLVLTSKGEYRRVTEAMAYDQTDPMVSIDVKHSVLPVEVTAGHPVMALRGLGRAKKTAASLKKLSQGKAKLEWVDAGDLRKGDYVAQPVPQDVVFDNSITEDDAYLYGLMLGDGHFSAKCNEAGVSLHLAGDVAIREWVEKYLNDRGIHFWQTIRDNYIQVGWTTSHWKAIRREDLYGNDGQKRVSRRFRHLPIAFASQMIKGLVDADGWTSCGTEVVFTNTSLTLVEDLRYQLLRMGVPSSGNKRVREYDHEVTRGDGTLTAVCGTTTCYDLRIPAVEEIASLFGVSAIKKHNWLRVGNFILSRVKSVEAIEPHPTVHDLKVEGMEEYATTAFLCHNGGKRKGAGCLYLETWHGDIEDFLELRKNTGDERRRCHDTNLANWIPDLFMIRVIEDGDWWLFSPSDARELHETCGDEFEKLYVELEKKAESGEIKNARKLKAKALCKRMLTMLFETGMGWFTFKDPSNIRYSNQHVGVVHNSNLCTEICLHTSSSIYAEGEVVEVGETAVCNLGSINVPAHLATRYVASGPPVVSVDWDLMRQTVRTAIRVLDNVIDLNYYPTKEARKANMNNRPIGLGLMGFADCLHEFGLSYEDDKATEFAADLQEQISYNAILASADLAVERGRYANYEGSTWSQGKLPVDTYEDFMAYRQRRIDYVPETIPPKLDWEYARKYVLERGMRNSNTMAIAPTATISFIVGCAQSIEPDFSVLYVYSTLSGEFMMINEYFVRKAKDLGIWGPALVDALKRVDGDVSQLDIPDALKREFKTAFNVDQLKLLDAGAARQKYIDMGQSLNLYANHTSLKTLWDTYLHAWKAGLKTTYYLRTTAASKVEKSAVEQTGSTTYTSEEKVVCSIKAQQTGEICEACQ
jgi:ribonucleoside-diphosphate reductase alpha chain